jgi:hypothetical protein
MTRKSARLSLGLLMLALVVTSLPGCPEPEEKQTPRDAFLASQARIEARDFESEWRFMSPAAQQGWGDQINKLKQHIRADPGNRSAQDTMLMEQYEFNADEFLAADPRLLHARYLEVNRQKLLRFEVLGEARIEGDTAELPVRLLKDEQPTVFRYVLRDGRWLLDEGMRGRE